MEFYSKLVAGDGIEPPARRLWTFLVSKTPRIIFQHITFVIDFIKNFVSLIFMDNLARYRRPLRGGNCVNSSTTGCNPVLRVSRCKSYTPHHPSRNPIPDRARLPISPRGHNLRCGRGCPLGTFCGFGNRTYPAPGLSHNFNTWAGRGVDYWG